MEHTDKMQMGFVGPLGQLNVFTLPFVPNWLPKWKPPSIYPPRLQHPSKLFLKWQPKMFYFDLSPDAKGFPSLLEALGVQAWAAASSGMLPPWSWFVARFVRWCPTGLNIIAAMLQNQNRGENEFYVRKMPFESINGGSKQHVGFFPSLQNPAFYGTEICFNFIHMFEEQCQL